jgi:hypothetical protein
VNKEYDSRLRMRDHFFSSVLQNCCEKIFLATEENVWMQEICLLIFGVARVKASNPSDMMGETGIPGYMAPEVCLIFNHLEIIIVVLYHLPFTAKDSNQTKI